MAFGDLPRIHDRESLVQEAEFKIKGVLIEACKELTYGEELRVLANVFGGTLSSIAKHTIREERHPGKPDKPGGLM